MKTMLRSLKGLYHLLIAVFAVVWFRFPGRRLTVVGVTGTDGKTTTTSLIYEILKAAGHKTSMISSVQAVIAGKKHDTGFHVTTPNAFWVQKFLAEAADHGDTHFVLEVTSHGLAQYRVWGIKFAVGIITNVTHEHLDWHGTFKDYLTTKLSLLKCSGVAVLNCDEEELYHEAKQVIKDQPVVTYGIKKKTDVTPQNYPFQTKLPGEFNRYNILAALAVTCEGLDVDRNIALRTVADFAGVPGRMEIIREKPFKLIIDFAHTPNGLDRALATARTITRQRIIHVFGSAGLRDRLKRPMMGKISAKYADVIVLTEEDYRTEKLEDIMAQIASGIPPGHQVYRYFNREEAIRFAIGIAKPGDTVILTGKGHEKSLCRGRVEYPWNEKKAVESALKNRLKLWR